MKTVTLTLAALALSAGVAFASSPAVILDAGTNPAYVGSTEGTVSTETGPVVNSPTAFQG